MSTPIRAPRLKTVPRDPQGVPLCSCMEVARKLTSRSAKNPNRDFLKCHFIPEKCPAYYWVDELTPWVPPQGHQFDGQTQEEDSKPNPNAFASSQESPSTPQKRAAYLQAPTPDSSPSKRPRVEDLRQSPPSPSPSQLSLPSSSPATSVPSGSQLLPSPATPTHDQMIEYHKLMKAEDEKKARLSLVALRKEEFTSTRQIKMLHEEIRLLKQENAMLRAGIL